MTAPVLRPAVPADEAFLLELASRLADFPLPHWRSREEIARADHAILKEALHRPGPETLILVAEDPVGHRAGYVFVASRTDYFTGRPHAHIEILAVAPDRERRGLGSALLDAAERWARDRGLDSITLNVFARNERALALYDGRGYTRELVRCWKALDPGAGT